MASVTPSLSGYSPGSGIANLQALANAGFESIIPVVGGIGCPTSTAYTVTINGWTLTEYICIDGNHRYGPDYEFKPGSVGLLLSETYKGGIEAVGIPNPNGDLLSSIQKAEQTRAAERSQAKVEIASGEVSIGAAPDLVTGAGDFPKSLSLVRSYSSSASLSEAWLPPPTQRLPHLFQIRISRARRGGAAQARRRLGSQFPNHRRHRQ